MPSLFKRLHAAFYPPPPEPTPAPKVVHADGWQNPLTGIGTARDKSVAGYFTPKYQIPHNELIGLFNGSALARKMVVKPVKEMFRRGWELKAVSNKDDDAKDPSKRSDAFPLAAAAKAAPPATARPAPKAPGTPPLPLKAKTAAKPPIPADVVDPKEQKALEKKLADILLVKRMMWGAIWGRLFGGAITIMGVMDGQTPDKPLNENNLQSFEFLNTVDRRYIWVQQYYSDPMSPKYGMPELYLVTNMVQVTGALHTTAASTTLIHETRVIRWGGNETDDITRQQLAGWDFSVLQTLYDTLKKFEHAFDSVSALMSDASQAVFKMQGLIDMITSGDKETLQARMAQVDMCRSTIKAVLLDSETESFERQPTAFGGLSDLLERWQGRLCADADIPKSELFGESPGGLNANASGETRKWYDIISSEQESELGPLLKRVINLVSKCADSPIKDKDIEWEINFRPLWSPTDLEDAQYRLAIAQSDNIYLTQGVVTPEQVALGRWGGPKFSPNIQVDAVALQEAIEGKVMQDPYENEPPPPVDPTLQGGGVGSSPNSPTPVPVGPNPSKTK